MTTKWRVPPCGSNKAITLHPTHPKCLDNSIFCPEKPFLQVFGQQTSPYLATHRQTSNGVLVLPRSSPTCLQPRSEKMSTNTIRFYFVFLSICHWGRQTNFKRIQNGGKLNGWEHWLGAFWIATANKSQQIVFSDCFFSSCRWLQGVSEILLKTSGRVSREAYLKAQLSFTQGLGSTVHFSKSKNYAKLFEAEHSNSQK